MRSRRLLSSPSHTAVAPAESLSFGRHPAADRYIAGAWWRIERRESGVRFYRASIPGWTRVSLQAVPREVRDELEVSLGISGLDRMAAS